MMLAMTMPTGQEVQSPLGSLDACNSLTSAHLGVLQAGAGQAGAAAKYDTVYDTLPESLGHLTQELLRGLG